MKNGFRERRKEERKDKEGVANNRLGKEGKENRKEGMTDERRKKVRKDKERKEWHRIGSVRKGRGRGRKEGRKSCRRTGWIRKGREKKKEELGRTSYGKKENGRRRERN